MKAKKTIAQLKKDLVTVLHKFIRLRDTVDGFGECISCGRNISIKEANAGHFLPSTYSAVKFDERNINLQCIGCNVWKRGNVIEYRPRLAAKIGKEQVEALENMRHNGLKEPREWYEEKIQYYKSLIHDS